MQKFINVLKSKPGIDYTMSEGKISVSGNLDLSYTDIEKLPDGLTISGSLDLYNTPIKELPDGLTVGGYLDLSSTRIKELPDGLTVGGSIIGMD